MCVKKLRRPIITSAPATTLEQFHFACSVDVSWKGTAKHAGRAVSGTTSPRNAILVAERWCVTASAEPATVTQVQTSEAYLSVTIW